MIASAEVTNLPGQESAGALCEQAGRHLESRVTEEADWVNSLRRSALSRFESQGFPTLRDEDWRFTNLAPLRELPLQPAQDAILPDTQSVPFDNLIFNRLQGPRLVFVNGRFVDAVSSAEGLPSSVQFGRLQGFLKEGPAAFQRHFGRLVHDADAIAALNTALFQDGVFLHVPRGVCLEQPLRVYHLTTADKAGVTFSPRNLLVVERGARVTLVESYVGREAGPYFMNPVTECTVGDGAFFEHLKVQQEGAEAFHVASLYSALSHSSRFNLHSISLGARLARNNIRTRLDGEGLECVLNGLYLTRQRQLSDHHMYVEHVAPHTASHEYFNGILDDQSKAVFHGRIYVHPEAQKTDAKQTNRNLLLSDLATVDTKPQLEIYADDVKCTHGATVGQMDEEAIFYMRARGVGPDTARRLLMHGFAGEILDRIDCVPARTELDQLIWDRLEQNPHLKECIQRS